MAIVNKIIPFSCVDGDGNRMVIFFQGCNIKCKYCHNPETINKCNACGLCIESCESKAISKENNKVFWNKEKCTGCDRCISVCKNLSTPKTTDYSVEELFEEIKKVKFFIQGITVSGGECTLNSDFLVELFKKVKDIGLTCFIDTNGTVKLDNKLIELTDKFMLDVKSIDKKESISLTGLTNKTILENLNLLLKENKLYEVRTVIAPNLNSEITVDKVSDIIKDKCKYKLIKYRKHGVRKEGLDFHGEVSPNDIYLKKLEDIAMKNGVKEVILT